LETTDSGGIIKSEKKKTEPIRGAQKRKHPATANYLVGRIKEWGCQNNNQPTVICWLSVPKNHRLERGSGGKADLGGSRDSSRGG
jgi:hypothetical protein